MADPLLESWKAGRIWQAQRKEREEEREREGDLECNFQKGVWFHPAGIWKGERKAGSRDKAPLCINFPLYEKLSTRKKKDYFNFSLRILEELRWKVGGKCRAWFWLNIMRYYRESCQSICTFLIPAVSQHSVCSNTSEKERRWMRKPDRRYSYRNMTQTVH